MSGFIDLPKLDNISSLGGLLTLPFLGERVGSSDAADERGRSHGPCNRDATAYVGEVEKSFAVFQARHVVANENGTFGQQIRHSHTPCSTQTERAGVDGISSVKSTENNWLSAVNVNALRECNDNHSGHDGDAA